VKKHYTIEVSKHLDKGTVYFPAHLSNKQSFTRISFGTFSIEAKCIPHRDRKNTLVLSPDLAKAIHFPSIDIPLHLFFVESTIHIGPLIGIITSGFTPFAMRPLGERSTFFAKLLSVKKFVGALPFIFGEKHINWEDGTIEGYIYHKNGWESIILPFPNVIYDRLPNRRSEKKAALRKVKDRLQSEYLIPWYNPGFFNKLDVFERLESVDEVASLLPETHPFTSFSMIERMLSSYGHVYVKPMNGSLGHGIFQIVYNREQDLYYCRFRENDEKNRLRKFRSLESLMKHTFPNKNLNHLLIQQGIDLIRFERNPVDFRVHTNKDENGVWNVTAVAAKVAGPGSVTTHVKSGGSIKTIEEVIDTKEDQEFLLKKLTEASLLLSQVLDTQMEGIIGEIGFDLGVDREGRVWLFEANSKPGRSIFKHPDLKEFDLLTRKLSLAFGVFLSEQAIKQPGEVFK
jgi:hypothetical protein